VQTGIIVFLKKFPWEALVWFTGLLFLAFHSPDTSTHFTVCPLALANIGWCPGCGLGTSVSLLLHGDVMESFSTHPLGIFALIVLSFRIILLTKKYIQTYG
jgi:hypothetical protein